MASDSARNESLPYPMLIQTTCGALPTRMFHNSIANLRVCRGTRKEEERE